MAIKVIKRLRYIRLSPDIIASLPVTDIRHILVEIDTYRHVLQMMEQIKQKRKYNRIRKQKSRNYDKK